MISNLAAAFEHLFSGIEGYHTERRKEIRE